MQSPKTNEIQLPAMTVEEREASSAHGIPAPDTSEANLNKELQLAIQLNQDAWKSNWENSTLEIIHDYLPEHPEDYEIVDAVKMVMGHDSWMDCVVFVKDDMCADFFNRALHYCLKEGQVHKKKKGFIDGSGIGYLYQYYKDLKPALEKVFDVKWYYQLERPLEWALKQGMDLTKVANHIHPGHWSYKAGHKTKFAQAHKTLNKVFHLDESCDRVLDIAEGVEAMARSGNLIHYPMDNVGVDGLLTT